MDNIVVSVFGVLEQVGMCWGGTGLWCSIFRVSLGAALCPQMLGAFSRLGPLARDWWSSTRGSCLLGNDPHPHGCVIGLHCRFPQVQGEFGAVFGVAQLPWHRQVSRPVCPSLTEGSCSVSALWALGRSRSCGFPGSLEQPQHR